MTLRRKLFVRYAIVAGICLLLLAGLAHHEFVVEPRVRAEMGIPKPSGSQWGEYAEMVFHGSIPVILGLGWWIMRRTLQPIHQFAARVEGIQANNLGQALPRTGNGDEIDRLTEVFNTMTQRLDRNFQHAREFAMHASHELKTPLTIMRGEFEARRDDAASPWCHTCAEMQLVEIDRLARIVDSLTLLTKADVGMVDIERKLVILPNLMCECFDDTQYLGEAQGIAVKLGACDTAVVLGDRDRLRQLLLNLSDNAVKYNKPGGEVTLSLRKVDGFAEIVITNTGKGIPPEIQDSVFKRFVRGPEAREQGVDGCGLGLSICQWIVEAHGGTISLSTAPDGLTAATVRLPALL